MLDLPQTMKAAVVRQIGGADAVVTETDFPTPKLKPGEVIVKNSVGGLNFIDTYFRSGLYKMETPFVSGQEGGEKSPPPLRRRKLLAWPWASASCTWPPDPAPSIRPSQRRSASLSPTVLIWTQLSPVWFRASLPTTW